MKNQKSLTNKGFSLVELIIVVAIMAILIGVLAPQYLRYVEKSRLQKDNTSIGEIANVLKMTSSDEILITAIGDGVKLTFNSDGELLDAVLTGANGTASTVNDELKLTLGDPLSKVKLTSNTYKKNGFNVEITATINSTTKIMEVKATNWVEPGATSTSEKIF